MAKELNAAQVGVHRRNAIAADTSFGEWKRSLKGLFTFPAGTNISEQKREYDKELKEYGNGIRGLPLLEHMYKDETARLALYADMLTAICEFVPESILDRDAVRTIVQQAGRSPMQCYPQLVQLNDYIEEFDTELSTQFSYRLDEVYPQPKPAEAKAEEAVAL